MAYKWSHPSEWLREKIDDSHTSVTDLRSYANALLDMVDGDQIQDTFQAEMDADGYFNDLEDSANGN